MCSFLGLLISQNLIWKSEAWVLETDFINNTYIVLGMLFNFSGFDYFMCKKGIFCLIRLLKVLVIIFCVR